MKPTIRRVFTSVLVFVVGLLLNDSAWAAVISPINSPITSASYITFNDTNSLSPSLTPGGAYTQNVTPWGGIPPINNALPLTTDPIGDFAQGNITADVIGGNYSIALNNVQLNQAPLNTGMAVLNFSFNVEFQLDGAGLPSQTTVFPNFAVNGTVQNAAGSYAAVNGFIDYYGVNAAGTYGVLETVNYNALFITPGNFSATVVGVPVNGTTPLLAPNTTLTLVGSIGFTVDPATLNAETVPEPGSGWLVGFALLGGLLVRLVKQGRSRLTAL